MFTSRIAVIYGTRPEAIKMAPLIKALRNYENLDAIAISTQQHESLLLDALESVGITTDLELAPPDRSSVQSLVSSIGLGLEIPVSESDLVVVQGDTISAYAGALAGLLQKKPVVHLEAGLRTANLYQPHPEEGLRRVITHLASVHLAPTAHARKNLESEGIPANSIVVTGNTSIDAIKDQLRNMTPGSNSPIANAKNYCVLTVHRRENWGDGLGRIARAVFQLSTEFPDVDFLCPLHPNPIVRESFDALPRGNNFRILDPLPHDSFVELLAGSQLILTDSGGIQEEATVLGVPVVILREETERPEVVDAGWGFIAGTNETQILALARDLLQQRLDHTFTGPDESPFGDGNAGTRAAQAISKFSRGTELPSDMAIVD